MDNYKLIVEWYKSTLLFKLSQIGYALNSDLLFSDRLELLPIHNSIELIPFLKDGNSVFIDFIALKTYNNVHLIFNKLKDLNIKLYFFFQFEPFLPHDIINLFLPISYHIFSNNNNFSHSNVHVFPIGIRDCGITIRPGHENFFHTYLFNQGLKSVNKKHLCLLGGLSNTHPDRKFAYDSLKDKSFVFDITNLHFSFNMTSKWGTVPVIKYYEFIHSSHFIIAPSGLGVDTHRFFEALYLKTIPIVKKTNSPFDKLYDIFPCLVIDNWNDISLDLLNTQLPILKSKIDLFFQTYPNLFFDPSVLMPLLLKT